MGNGIPEHRDTAGPKRCPGWSKAGDPVQPERAVVGPEVTPRNEPVILFKPDDPEGVDGAGRGRAVGVAIFDRKRVFIPRRLAQVAQVDRRRLGLAELGHGQHRVFEPMGLDWRYGVAILMSFLAREVFVGALGTLFGVSMLARDNARRFGLLLAAGMTVLLFLVPVLGAEINGARRWPLHQPPFSRVVLDWRVGHQRPECLHVVPTDSRGRPRSRPLVLVPAIRVIWARRVATPLAACIMPQMTRKNT